MATPTVVGSLIATVLADDALTALLGGRIYRDVQPEENQLPFVEVSDKEEPPIWITKRHRVEKHHIQARVYAPAGATIGVDNQAVAIADNLERVWNWDELALLSWKIEEYPEPDIVVKG
jgi:hypothetical protein